MLRLAWMLALLPVALSTTDGFAAWSEDVASPIDCLQVRAIPVHEGVGWSHYVELVNVCDLPMQCDVATDMDPEPSYPVVVGAHAAERVRTRFGSFSPLFSPVVSCEIVLQ